MRIIAGAYKGRELRTVTGPGYRPAMGQGAGKPCSPCWRRGA